MWFFFPIIYDYIYIYDIHDEMNACRHDLGIYKETRKKTKWYTHYIPKVQERQK